jgi:hypothetical protein
MSCSDDDANLAEADTDKLFVELCSLLAYSLTRTCYSLLGELNNSKKELNQQQGLLNRAIEENAELRIKNSILMKKLSEHPVAVA